MVKVNIIVVVPVHFDIIVVFSWTTMITDVPEWSTAPTSVAVFILRAVEIFVFWVDLSTESAYVWVPLLTVE
jgi:ABC-type taurine transport system substrate-binding protein